MSDEIRDEQLKTIAEKWIEAARMGCVDAFECALKDAWQAALSQHPAPVAVPEGLRERCKELIEWQKTGVLVGSALRSYSKVKLYAEEHNSLQMAEADTAREAYALITAAPSAPTPAAQEPVGYCDPGHILRRWRGEILGFPLHSKQSERFSFPVYAATPAAEQPECGCCGQTGEGDPDCGCAEQPDTVLSMLGEDDMYWLRRFRDCREDDEDEHDLPEAAILSLETLGALRSIGHDQHELTKFGDYLLGKDGEGSV